MGEEDFKGSQKDKRQYAYTLRELEPAKTHDPYWNAAQKEVVIKGKMHGYMRMYWERKSLNGAKGPKNLPDNALPE